MRTPRVFVAGPVSWNRLVLLDRLPPPRPHAVSATGRRHVGGQALNLSRLGAEVAEQHLNLMDPCGGRASIYLEVPRLRRARHDARTSAALRAADAAVVDLADHARPPHATPECPCGATCTTTTA